MRLQISFGRSPSSAPAVLATLRRTDRFFLIAEDAPPMSAADVPSSLRDLLSLPYPALANRILCRATGSPMHAIAEFSVGELELEFPEAEVKWITCSVMDQSPIEEAS
jgi:hypothetical protein